MDFVTDNPYAAPSAPVQDTRTTAGTIRIYSPTQVACGTIGGPVGLIYFLKDNFAALGNKRLERKTLFYGGLLLAVLAVTLPFLPENFPSLPFTLAYILTARYVAVEHQMTRQAIADSPIYDFHSNWRVLGIGLLCLVASVIVLMGPIFLLVFLGILDP